LIRDKLRQAGENHFPDYEDDFDYKVVLDNRTPTYLFFNVLYFTCP